MHKLKSRKLIRAASIILLTFGLAFFAVTAYLKAIEDTKRVRHAKATIVSKVHVQFDQVNHSYTDNLGHIVEKSPGDEEWRVYVVIDDFGNFDTSTRKRLKRIEDERVAAGNIRFVYDTKEWYEQITIGDKLELLIQRLSDHKVLIVGFNKVESTEEQ